MIKREPWPEKAGTEQAQLTLSWDAVGRWSRCGHVACTQEIQHGALSNQCGLRLSALGQGIWPCSASPLLHWVTLAMKCDIFHKEPVHDKPPLRG